MDRAQKAESIETLKGVFEGAGAVVVTHYLGLTVARRACVFQTMIFRSCEDAPAAQTRALSECPCSGMKSGSRQQG